MHDDATAPSAPRHYAFLHGGGQGGWVWRETIAALEAQTGDRYGRALLLDIPGCGSKRGRDTDGVDLDAIVTELIGEIDAAGLTDIVLVGHSQAGTVLPALAEKRPDLFRRLVYVSCSAPLPDQSIRQMMGSSRAGTNADEVGWPLDPAEHPLAAQFPAMFCNDMTPDHSAAFLAGLGQDHWPLSMGDRTGWPYDHLDSVPTSYVICLADGILPPHWQEVFAARFRADRLVRIDAGHQVMNTRPHALAEILRIEAAIDV